MTLSIEASRLSGNGFFPDEFHIDKSLKLITIRKKQGPVMEDGRILHVSEFVCNDVALKYMMEFPYIAGDLDSNVEEHVRQFNYPV